ncbi:MAG: BatB protein, partial [Flavobacteriia bacterium]|nr:BatB protein [Flavobacteriia bacterium]
MYQLDAPFYFYLLGIVPLFWGAYLLVARWKRLTQKQFAQVGLMEKLSPNRSRFKPAFK